MLGLLNLECQFMELLNYELQCLEHIILKFQCLQSLNPKFQSFRTPELELRYNEHLNHESHSLIETPKP